MFSFKNHNQVPPKGYNFRATTGLNINARNYYQWLDHINAHQTANNLPSVTPQEAQDQNCRSLSPSAAGEFCRDEDADKCIDAVSLKASDIYRGTKGLAIFKLSGSPLVPQDEAERRAAICVRCPYNVQFRKPCIGLCRDLVELIGSIVGGAKTSLDSKLNACAVCKCSLPAKIHVPTDILNRIDGNSLKYPENCWLYNENS